MFLSKIGAGVAVGTAIVLGASSALAANGWTIVLVPPTGQNASLSGVSSTSDTDAWAVGYCCAAPNFLGAKPVIDHWNGASWSQVPAPPTGYNTNSLTAVSASSATDAWAVGRSEPYRYTFYPLAMHWNGTAWSVSSSFVAALSGQLGVGVADISPTDAYAIDYLIELSYYARSAISRLSEAGGNDYGSEPCRRVGAASFAAEMGHGD
jgi:hypothetical protein